MHRKVVAAWVSLAMISGFVVFVNEICPKVTAYTPHVPIRINSNAEFASLAGIEGWSGDGSPGNPYIIEGYDINGSDYGYCIYIGNTTVDFKVLDCYLHEASGSYSPPYFSRSGLILYNTQNGIISNNIALDNYDGIRLDSSINNTIADNTASWSFWDGIYLSLSRSNIITNNTFSNSNYGIYLTSSNNNLIANNNASSNINNGFYIWSSIGNKITNNTILNNSYGIALYSSNSNTIANNTLSINIDGIYLYSSISNLIVQNDVSSNKVLGIYLEYSSDYNTLFNNNFFSNKDYGIYLYSCGNNIITNNFVSNSQYGIYLPSSSSSNTIYHNNFIDNSNQAYDNTNNGNQWDDGYPSGGNYWSDFNEPNEGAYDDYQGPDQNVLGNDGIVDNGTGAGGGKNPYIIDSDSQDNYPLISPIGNYTFLFEGWNLISVPFIQSETNPGAVLSSITGSYDAVQLFNTTDMSDPWKHNHTGKPQYLNDLNALDHTIGFWIHITKPGGILFEYQGVQPAVNQTIPIHPGWNMVGYPSLTNHNRTNGLNNIEFNTDIDCIQWFDAATKTWHFMGPDDSFVPGRGYWMHSDVNTIWEVPI